MPAYGDDVSSATAAAALSSSEVRRPSAGQRRKARLCAIALRSCLGNRRSALRAFDMAAHASCLGSVCVDECHVFAGKNSAHGHLLTSTLGHFIYLIRLDAVAAQLAE